MTAARRVRSPATTGDGLETPARSLGREAPDKNVGGPVLHHASIVFRAVRRGRTPSVPRVGKVKAAMGLGIGPSETRGHGSVIAQQINMMITGEVIVPRSGMGLQIGGMNLTITGPKFRNMGLHGTLMITIVLGHPREILGHLGDILGNSGGIKGHSRDMLGHPGEILGHHMKILGHPVKNLGHPMGILGHPMGILGHPKTILGHLGKNLGH